MELKRGPPSFEKGKKRTSEGRGWEIAF